MSALGVAAPRTEHALLLLLECSTFEWPPNNLGSTVMQAPPRRKQEPLTRSFYSHFGAHKGNWHLKQSLDFRLRQVRSVARAASPSSRGRRRRCQQRPPPRSTGRLCKPPWCWRTWKTRMNFQCRWSSTPNPATRRWEIEIQQIRFEEPYEEPIV